MSKSSAWPFHVDLQQDFAWVEDGFSKEECEKIKEIGLSMSLADGVVGNNVSYDKDESYRNSKISWIYPKEDTSWIFRRLTDIVGNMNARYFAFDLFGFVEGLQFSVYEAPSGKYDFHIDKAINGNIRKLSIVVLLSDESDYSGGDFEVLTGKKEQQCVRKQGTVLVMPSYILHRVTEVTSGTRNSLVGWVTGPAFR